MSPGMMQLRLGKHSRRLPPPPTLTRFRPAAASPRCFTRLTRYLPSLMTRSRTLLQCQPSTFSSCSRRPLEERLSHRRNSSTTARCTSGPELVVAPVNTAVLPLLMSLWSMLTPALRLSGAASSLGPCANNRASPAPLPLVALLPLAPLTPTGAGSTRLCALRALPLLHLPGLLQSP